MPQLAAQQPPPPDYYAENLRRVLHHVGAYYADLLKPEERAFADRLVGSSGPAQRLFARLIGRKGPWIRVDKLNYVEVEDVEATLGELQRSGLIQRNGPAPADALLGLLTNDERKGLFPEVAGPSKPRWIESCVARYCDRYVAERVAAEYPWVSVRGFSIIALYQLLFFGDPRQDLTAFVLQDLGLMRYEDYALSTVHRQFADRSGLNRYQRLRALHGLSHRVDELPTLAGNIAGALWIDAETRLEQRVKDKTLNRLGRWYERRGDFDAALDCYARSESHPARERTARLLQRLGDEPGVERILGQMRSDPRASEEEDFAERFGARRRRRSIPTTELGLCGPVPGSIEQFAIETLTAGGGQGWHLESRFSLGIAGLAFWPVLFADVPGAFVNPFQTGPVDLSWPDFLEPRAQILDAQLEKFRDPAVFVHTVRRNWAVKHGIANRLVSWTHFDAALLEAVLGNIPADALLSLAQFVLENLHRLRAGFPDLLLIYGPGDYEFVEVKGPTDQLQPGQRIWFKALAELALPARIVKFKA